MRTVPKWKENHRWPVLLAALALLPGCAGTARFVDPEADVAYYGRVAVIPFTALAQDRLAGEKVADVFFTALLSSGFAEVVEPGQFTAAMVKIRGGTPLATPWSSRDLARLGEDSKVQGIFMGTVRSYDMTRVGRDAYPLISLEVRLVDCATGRVVWSADQTRRGGPALPLLGWGEVHTLGELTSRVCHELLGTLPRE